MKEFTITNIFRCWLKMWPITVVLVILGLGAGWFSTRGVVPEYTVEVDLLIVDERDGSNAVEYAGLANSDLVSNPTFNTAAVNDKCTMVASGKGDIISFVATCPTNQEEAERLANAAAENFTAWAQDIYGEDNFKTVSLADKSKDTHVAVNYPNKLAKILVPGLAMLVVSLVIAFVYLDYKVSKGHGKKA